MDHRWLPCSQDSKRQVKIILHPVASIAEIREGLFGPSDDSVDITELVSAASHSQFECGLTLNWNRELFGAGQPKPNQILEVQLYQNSEWKPLWIGIVDRLSSFTMSRGQRSMQLSAKSRDSQDIWRTTKRVTPLFPQLTDLVYMATRIAKTAGLSTDEILLPPSAFTTAHSNTQLADMCAWDMIESLFVPLGWKPFIDSMGRLKAANRDLQHRTPDVVLTDERLIEIVAQRQKPPVSRVNVQWLNPTLKKNPQQGRKLGEATITMGWFLPFIRKKIFFSDDMTLRAENTYMIIKQSANALHVPVCFESYDQQTENEGRIELVSPIILPLMVGMAIGWAAAHNIPDAVPGTGVTVPVGRRVEAAFQIGWALILMSIGTGIYEIWGTPFDWVHARNTTVAFDSSAPPWVDTAIDIETDFIVNEPHAQAVAVRELIFSARSANKWAVNIVDDPRIEFGDIIQFSDGSQLYVEDFHRTLTKGSEAVLKIEGFLLGPSALASAAAAVS